MTDIITLQIAPHRPAVLSGHDSCVDVLVRFVAPERPPAKAHVRAPVNLALVIDRSGSMSGAPLEEAKRCVRMIIDRLGPDDRASLVVYDNGVDVLVPSQAVRDKATFHAAIRGITTGGMTALHAGWAKGAEQAALGLDRGRMLSRVLILSDGQANEGLTDPGQIGAQCAEMAAAGVSTSTYGLGNGFNEDLMGAMARQGRGNAYYGDTADDLLEPFQQEFDLLSSLCARQLRLHLAAADGVTYEVLNRYPTEPAGRVRLPDVAYGGEAWAMIRLTVPRSVRPAAGEMLHLLTASVDYETLDGERRVAGPSHLRLPALPVGAFEAVAKDGAIGARLAELRAANLQDDARTAARSGNWPRVDQIISELRVEAEESPWLLESLREVEALAVRRETQRLSKELFFKSRMMRERLAEANEASEFDISFEMAKPSYLRRKPLAGKRMLRPDNEPGSKS